ncbi:MAG: transcriptional repressor [Thermodesulfobacteriota bacterium]|nr:MAG: transcriptional repressor [Thermodesulfobacteriota bacterium]
MIKETLERSNIKPTSQRTEIARVLLSKAQHLSAEQVLHLVNANDGQVSKATVYNTLSLFVKKGLVRQVIIDPTKIFYDSNTSLHYHFYNEDTGELSDFESDDMGFMPIVLLPENTVKSGVDVIVRVKNTK